jgi:hypothetical protein
MILARNTINYSNVYFIARKDNSHDSSGDKIMLYGLFRGIHLSLLEGQLCHKPCFIASYYTLLYL